MFVHLVHAAVEGDVGDADSVAVGVFARHQANLLITNL
jgi:hypothetical protein